MRTLVIAEPGSTHEGDLGRMLELVDLAADIGCDVIKPQWLSSSTRLCERRHAPEYLNAYRLIEYPLEWIERIAEQCRANSIKLAVSVYLPEDVVRVSVLPGVHYLKCASFEADAKDMHAALKEQERPVIVSMGMGASLAPWTWVYAVLHCVSSYPTPSDQANLGTIRALRDSWSRRLAGYSDHTLHPMAGALAVAAGAQVVEFHIRHPLCSPTNADYAVSRSLLGAAMRARLVGEVGAAEYVRNIRMAEMLMGDGTLGPMPCEEAMMRYRANQP
mgnify:CR=1 FL=1